MNATSDILAVLGKIDQPVIDSLSQLLPLIDEFTRPGRTIEEPAWSFRGQNNQWGNLKPGLARKVADLSDSAISFIEEQLLELFRSRTPMVNREDGTLPKKRELGPGYDLRCLSAMQHLEIPTRLLDWTCDIYVALFFACSGRSNDGAEIWSYDRRPFGQLRVDHDELNLFLHPPGTQFGEVPPEPKFLGRPEYHKIIECQARGSGRGAQQLAHHTASIYPKADHAPLIADLISNSHPNDPLSNRFRRYLLSPKAKNQTLIYLEKYRNITAFTMFPDLEGVRRLSEWRLDQLMDDIS